MSNYEPGTVAIATVRGVEGVRVMRTENGDWRSAIRIHETGIVHDDRDVTDVHPLVVLDTSVPNSGRALGVWVRECAEYLRSNGQTAKASVLTRLLDQIEAQTKPPRIPEPGLWGVVEAKRRELDGSTATAEGKWIRVDAMVCPWSHTSGNYTADWADLIDPTLVREGVES